MALQVLEGTWEEVQRHAAELSGRRVRVEVLNGATTSKEGRTYSTPEERLAAFQAWTASHKDITAVILDDSREAIYGDEDRG